MTDPLADDRLTLSGLLFEASWGLRSQLASELSHISDLSVGDFEILLRLARSPGHELRMSDLADQAMLTRSGLTRAIDRLEAEGYVQRGTCASDRRGAFAQLTTAGLTHITDVTPVHLEQLSAHLDGILTARETEQFRKLLTKVRDHVHPGGVPRLDCDLPTS